MPERTDPWFVRIHTLFPRLRDPRIERTIRGLSRKARIHALRSAIHGLSPILGLRTTYACMVQTIGMVFSDVQLLTVMHTRFTPNVVRGVFDKLLVSYKGTHSIIVSSCC